MVHLRPLLLNFFVNYESFIAKYAPFDTPQMDDQILLGLNRAWRCVYYRQGVQPTEDEVVIENGAVEGPNVTLPAARQHFVAPFLARCVAEMSQALPVEQAEAYSVPVHSRAFQHGTEVPCMAIAPVPGQRFFLP